MRRESIDVAGLGHGELPIPAASRIGPFVATGGIRGVDRDTGILADDPQQQADRMFDNLETVLEAAGATPEQVLKVTIWVRDSELRSLVNAGWVRLFPDPKSRPARHILIHHLPGTMVVQCEALAIIG